jgi:hypothetical protein
MYVCITIYMVKVQAVLLFCNMNAFFLFDIFMVYIPAECKQQLRTMK